MNISQVFVLAAIFGGWPASPAQSADANSDPNADKSVREMKLDAFLSRSSGQVVDYKEASEPAKKEEMLGKLRKAIQADANGLVLTLSGRVADVKIQKDGSVRLGLSQVEEIEKLRGHPLMGLFRRGTAEWAEGGSLCLKMTTEQAAGIKKGDPWLLRGRAVFEADANSVGEGADILVYMAALVRGARFVSEKTFNVGALDFPKSASHNLNFSWLAGR